MSSLSKVILVLGKVRISRAPNLGCRELNHLGYFMFHKKKKNKKTCTRLDAWVGTLLWWFWQSLVAHTCGLLNHPNSFHGGMFKLNAKFDADSLLNLLSHFECDIHTVHMLTQLHLPPPLTSTVKSSLFTHVHSGPLSLAASLHRCPANHSRYVNNGWTLSRQISCTSTHCTVWTFIGF